MYSVRILSIIFIICVTVVVGNGRVLSKLRQINWGEDGDEHERSARSTSSSESSEFERNMTLMKNLFSIGYNRQKGSIIATFINDLADSDSNFTIVGWQNIYNDDGSIQKINTIELAIPPKPKGSDNGKKVDGDDDDDDDEDEDEESDSPMKYVKELREMLEPMSEIGLPARGTMERYSKDGKEELSGYLDLNQFYAKEKGFATYNVTEQVSPDYVRDFIKSKEGKVLDVGVLNYDSKGKFMEDDAKISELFMGSVMDSYDATDRMMKVAPMYMSIIAVTYPKEEIPKQLAAKFKKEFPEYRWRVLVDPGDYYIDRDIDLTLTYDNLDFDLNSNVSYLVYGKKISK